MLRYSLLMLVLAYSAVNGLVNDEDAAKSARLATVQVTIDSLPKAVVGLPSSDTNVANVTQSSSATQSTSSNSTQLANTNGAALLANKLTNGANTADHQESDATKSPIAVESSEKEQVDIKKPTPAPHLDSKDPSTSNEHSEKPRESSKKNDTKVSPTTTTPTNNETNLSEDGEDTITTTVSTINKPEVTDPNLSGSIGTVMKTSTSTTEESVSTLSTSSSTTEAATTKASATAGGATPENEGMSSGTIALIMAIVFTVVVVIVYAGLLLWRRYLEYRYGTRELLVNDLEFDTNDLRHFEL